jgi:drug/metabolite transporter (DMT)-like permease
MLRKTIFLAFVGAGVLLGVVAAIHGDWGLRIVMAGLGALVGAAVGGAAIKLGRRATERRVIPGMGTTTADIAANFWRDKGRPPA